MRKQRQRWGVEGWGPGEDLRGRCGHPACVLLFVFVVACCKRCLMLSLVLLFAVLSLDCLWYARSPDAGFSLCVSTSRLDGAVRKSSHPPCGKNWHPILSSPLTTTLPKNKIIPFFGGQSRRPTLLNFVAYCLYFCFLTPLPLQKHNHYETHRRARRSP